LYITVVRLEEYDDYDVSLFSSPLIDFNMSDISGKGEHDMKTLSTSAEDDSGHEIGIGDVQAVGLQKSFHLWSALGISFSVTSVPLAIGTYLSVSVGVGGSPVYFFGYVVSVIFNLCICASLAELAAVFPHSSGN
jgi:hypothetical protein